MDSGPLFNSLVGTSHSACVVSSLYIARLVSLTRPLGSIRVCVLSSTPRNPPRSRLGFPATPSVLRQPAGLQSDIISLSTRIFESRREVWVRIVSCRDALKGREMILKKPAARALEQRALSHPSVPISCVVQSAVRPCLPRASFGTFNQCEERSRLHFTQKVFSEPRGPLCIPRSLSSIRYMFLPLFSVPHFFSILGSCLHYTPPGPGYSPSPLPALRPALVRRPQWDYWSCSDGHVPCNIRGTPRPSAMRRESQRLSVIYFSLDSTLSNQNDRP